MTGHSLRVLDPSERTAEVLFGLIMVLTFTGSLSITEAGRPEIRTMLIGALGCNLAWGIIDGVLYLMGALAERSRDLQIYRAVRTASVTADTHRVIADALPPIVASTLDPIQLEHIRQRLQQLPDGPADARLHASDWTGALGVFLLVFLSTFPVALPFIFMQNPAVALRASNAIAVSMLFVVGAAYGRSIGRSPARIGISMVGLGLVLVAMTMALGG
jgi:VIT1/CCC1 family predicted Fe2+/Mn2+ transporter